MNCKIFLVGMCNIMSLKNELRKVITADFNEDKNLYEVNKKIEKNKKLKVIYVYSALLIIFFSIMTFNISSSSLIKISSKDNIYINVTDIGSNTHDIDFRTERVSLSMLPSQYNILNKTHFDENKLSVYKIYASNINDSDKYNELLGYEYIYESMSIFVSSNYETNPQNAEIIMSNLRRSNINNLDLIICEYNEFYRAIFKLNDIYFDLEIKDEKEELIKIVKNISS